MAAHKVGDQVRVNADGKYPGVWTVTKVNPKRYVLHQEGMGRGLTVPHEYVSADDGTQPAVAAPAARQTPLLDPGTFVRLVRDAGTGTKRMPKGLVLIVTVDKYERINCVVPGGEGGRYWRLPYGAVEAITVPEALEAMIGQVAS
jgi:hypothetical protein